MNGMATLYLNTHANAFDYYGVSREPYLGDPDRSRAPLSPFPGPGGGMGLYVSIVNDLYRTNYGHFDLEPTMEIVPTEAFAEKYSPTFDYRAAFANPQHFSVATEIAAWRVHRGDLLGYAGDSGYSEAPHLHYHIIDLASGASLCPTTETGFENGGWLLRQP